MLHGLTNLPERMQMMNGAGSKEGLVLHAVEIARKGKVSNRGGMHS